MTVPTLRTDRLTLTMHQPADWGDLAAMWSDPAIYSMIGGQPRSSEEVWIRLLRSIGQWQAFGYGSWVLRDHAGAFVGECGLLEARRQIDPPLTLPEMGWTLASSMHGKGYAREALTAILDWADARGIGHTTCIIDPANAPSLRLAERLGYKNMHDATYHDRPIRILERGGAA